MSAVVEQELNAIIQKLFDHIKDLYTHVRQHELKLGELAQASGPASGAAGSTHDPLAPVPADRPVRVAFFVQAAAENWNSTASVWRAFADDPRCDTKLVLMPFVHPDYPAGRTIATQFIEQSIPFVRCEHYDVRRERPDVAFFQNPYDHTRPAPFHVANVLPLVRRIAYVPYGLEIGGGSNNLMLQFAKPLQQNAWRVFVRSERAKRLYALHCPAGNAHCVVTGHPKLDAVLATRPEHVDPELAAWAEGKRVVLWNPHFSVCRENNLWSTFMKWKDVLLRFFEERRDLALLARPHPMLFKHALNERMMTADEIAAFRARIAASPNIRLDERSDYRHAFAVSSALLSDGSSFLLEYPATGKPLLYLPNPGGVGLNEDGEVVGSYYQAQNEPELLEFLNMVARGEDPKREARMARYAEFMHGIDGKVGERIRDHVVEAARAGR
jgi:CDP-glycerol:poly(glycerophosphate) glycerophosphotransferase